MIYPCRLEHKANIFTLHAFGKKVTFLDTVDKKQMAMVFRLLSRELDPEYEKEQAELRAVAINAALNLLRS